MRGTGADIERRITTETKQEPGSHFELITTLELGKLTVSTLLTNIGHISAYF